MPKSLIERITNIIHNSVWDFLNVNYVINKRMTWETLNVSHKKYGEVK